MRDHDSVYLQNRVYDYRVPRVVVEGDEIGLAEVPFYLPVAVPDKNMSESITRQLYIIQNRRRTSRNSDGDCRRSRCLLTVRTPAASEASNP